MATTLPHVMEYNLSVRADKYAEVAKALAPSGSATAAGAIDAALQLRRDIGIEKSISALGAEEGLLPALVEDALADPVNFSNPRPVDAAALEGLYRAAW